MSMKKEDNKCAILVAIILMIVTLVGTVIWAEMNDFYNKSFIDDNSWHMGYKDCERNFNLSSDEQALLNIYRMNKIVDTQKAQNAQNKTFK